VQPVESGTFHDRIEEADAERAVRERCVGRREIDRGGES
jgi:hypothetical protein